eukprot:EG_transcript_19264
MSSAVPHRPSSARHGHRLPDPAAVAEQWEGALRQYNAHTNIYSSAAYDKLPWHIEDSWRLARRVAGQAVLDLGSGSGLPAVFLAAGTAPAEVYAVESKSRKTRFLKEVKSELGLRNLHVITANARELCRRWAFDVPFVTAKAFKKVPEVVEVAAECVAGRSTLLVPISRAQLNETAGGRVEEDPDGYLYYVREIRPSRRKIPPVYRGEEDDRD